MKMRYAGIVIKAVWLHGVADCSLGVPMCCGCIRVSHRENPFHRIEQWNGNFFRPAELWEVGTHLLIRHHTGKPLCKTLVAQEEFVEMMEKRKDNAEEEKLNRWSISQETARMHSTAQELAQELAQAPAPAQAPFVENDEDIDMSHPGVNDNGDDEQFIQYLEKL